MRIAVIIPTMRGPKCLESFIEIAPTNVDFIILSEQKLEKKYERTTEFNDKEIFEKSWIFNRYTKRNFGFAYAYNQNYDMIINLDDDCFPTSKTFFDEHMHKLQSTSSDFFNILNLFSDMPKNVLEHGTRGYPTKIQKKFPIVINQGLWNGDLDLPALTIANILNSKNGKIPLPISKQCHVANDFTIPKDQLVTLCGMNISFLKEVVPAFPYAYQDADGFRLARYDDIWSGIFVKIILDKLGKRMSVGFPIIRHEKGERNVNNDIELEKKGESMNNFLWNNLPNLVLEGNDYTTCYLEIADWLEKVSDVPEREFFKKVLLAMYDWIKYLEN